MKSSKVIGAMVPWLLIIIGVAVMYQVARRSGLTSALGGLTQRAPGRSTIAGGAGAGAGGAGGGGGGIAEVLGALVSGPTTGDATGGGKGVSGPNTSPLAGSVLVGSAGPRALLRPVDLAPGPQIVTVPTSVVSGIGAAVGIPVGARVVEHTDARVNQGQPQLISLADGWSASEFAARLAP